MYTMTSIKSCEKDKETDMEWDMVRDEGGGGGPAGAPQIPGSKNFLM